MIKKLLGDTLMHY